MEVARDLRERGVCDVELRGGVCRVPATGEGGHAPAYGEPRCTSQLPDPLPDAERVGAGFDLRDIPHTVGAALGAEFVATTLDAIVYG